MAAICGYIFIIIHSFAKGLSMSQSNIEYYALSILSLVFLAIKAYHSTFSKKEFIFYFIALFVGILVFATSTNLTILLSIMAIFAAKDLSTKKLLGTIFVTRTISFFLMVLLSTMNIIPDNNLIFDRSGEILYRMSFGYLHPNETALQIIIIITSLTLLLNERWKKNISLAAGFVLGYLIYWCTYSRSTFIALLLFIILEFCVINFRSIFRLILKYSKWIALMPFFITIVFALFYQTGGIFNVIDKIFTGRLYYIDAIINFARPKLFGIDYGVFNDEKIYIDNGFVKLLYIDGIICCVMAAIYANNFLNICKNRRKSEYVVLFVSILFYALTESSLDNAINSYIWLIYPTMVTSRKMEELL